MKIQILASQRAAHQWGVAESLVKGISRFGHTVEVVQRASEVRADIAVAWGWRNAQKVAADHVLVAERAYLGDRFYWTSLGWDGLNGRARFPQIDDPTRLHRNFPLLLKPWVDRDENDCLVLGQVPTDAAVPAHYEKIMRKAVKRLLECGRRVYFRPHPKWPQLNLGLPVHLRFSVDEDIYRQFDRVGSVMTFNSNAGVLAVCAGVPAMTMDHGSMAWDVTSHTADSIIRPDREQWAARLAWCQWKPEEMSDGTAWEFLETCL